MRTLEQILKDKAQFERERDKAQAKVDNANRELAELQQRVTLAMAA